MIGWIKKALVYMRDFEPAMLKSIYIAVLGVLSTLGIVVSPAVNDKALGYITAAVTVISVLQALWTRRAVYAPAVVAAMAAAGNTPVLSVAEVKAMPEGGYQDLDTPADPDVPEDAEG